MTLFLVLHLVGSLLSFMIAWMLGGHPERRAVIALIIAFFLTYATQAASIGELRIGEALIDIGLLIVFLRLAFTHDRWWTILGSANMVLILGVHAAVLFVPAIDPRADVAARYGLGILVIASPALGVIEHWMSGAPPVSAAATWRRRRPT